jgi:O-antigen biosynthesis protein WbqV
MPELKLRNHRMPRTAVALLHDTVMAAAAFMIALFLRLGNQAPAHIEHNKLLPIWALFTFVCMVSFLLTGLYRGLWRYASLNDLMNIVKAVTLAMLIFLPIAFLITRLEAVPRSSYVITWFMLIFLLGAPRMLYRVFKDRGLGHLLEKDYHLRTPVVLVGTGDAADGFIREMARDRHAPYEVLALVDEKGTRIGRNIRGIPVLGHLDDIGEILDSLTRRDCTAQRIVLTCRLPREAMERLLDAADAKGVTIARLPRLANLAGEEAAASTIHPIAIEDLLGRTQNKLDRESMERLIAGRRVLVTGAGGSIGSELVRQLAAFGPSHLSLLDNSEALLYNIDLEVGEQWEALSRRAILADVRDRHRLDQILADEKPDLVFHAAALKHVPLVEANPVEGVLTNVIGTRNTAAACRKAGVMAMVFVSSDKAVNPPNVMGTTKRLAESYCQSLDLQEQKRAQRLGDARRTRFITVRFGNVLGSTGSVVPLFQHQISAGGPVTVTHPEVSRFFMTVREAVELILQATALGVDAPADEAGKIYVLDMGQPVEILDLARQMIRLAGLRPEKDIEIVFTGLRAGEKLHEELFHAQETPMPSRHPGLRLAASRAADFELLSRGLKELAQLGAEGDSREVCALLAHLVPEYQGPPNRPETTRAAS